MEEQNFDIRNQQWEIENRIFTFCGVHVMIDRDLANLYDVETRIINQAVKRNTNRFPSDFCFQLSEEEFINWKSQIVISESDKIGLRKRPYAFTEQGVSMLASVLRSDAAVQISVQIYHIGASLKDLGKKWFAFSKMNSETISILNKLSEK